tara:strand:- start:20 stop:205 length:186 start_codon:yes stop_codon:yes gene_type:complete
MKKNFISSGNGSAIEKSVSKGKYHKGYGDKSKIVTKWQDGWFKGHYKKTEDKKDEKRNIQK